MKKDLAERIRSLRASKGLKQEDIADQLGIAIGTYSNIERGKTDITVTRLYEIAEILDVSVYSFLADTKMRVHEPTPTSLSVSEELKEEIRKLIKEEIAKAAIQYPLAGKKKK